MNTELELAMHAATEMHNRKIDGLAMFRPMQRQEEFFLSASREILLRGGNRAGKSLAQAIRFAAIARDKPVTFADGSKHEIRQPHQKELPLVMWVVGWDGRHIGKTIYRLLFRAGAYKIIRDAKTREWRAYNPDTDAAREAETKPAPPLIPMSEVENIAWENKGEFQFNVVRMKNGTIIYAYSSMGEVPQGDAVDEIWVDEAIKYPRYYAEYQARIADNKGRIVWTSWPKRGNQALRTLTKRARDASKDGTTEWVREFVWTFSGNMHIDASERERTRRGWGEEDRISRDLGEYAVDQLKMYPYFSPDIHCAWGDVDADDLLAGVLRANEGQPPHDWTRFLVLDPGTNYPAVLFCAVPPPSFGDYFVPYDELYPGRCDAETLAGYISDKTFGQQFQWFIADLHGTAPTPMGFSISVGDNYTKAFADKKLRSAATGSSFLPGCVNVLGRIGRLNRLLTIQGNGRSALRIVTQKCPKLCQQMLDYEKGIHEISGEILDTPAKHQQIDLPQCLEYAAAFDWYYVEPPAPAEVRRFSPAVEKYLKQRQSSNRGSMVHCGPESATSAA